MTENSRIDDLRRRVQKDPASIAFAQLAEECRRAGAYQEAVDTCRSGLEIHPGYLSARVTLGRALVELDHLDEAEAELLRVLEGAPENLAAIRGLAEIYHRRGDFSQALAKYKAALLLARNDPDLEQTIADLSRRVEPLESVPAGDLTIQNMQAEILSLAPKNGEGQLGGLVSADTTPVPFSVRDDETVYQVPEPDATTGVDVVPPSDGTLTVAADDRPARTIAALEQWLDAIHVSRQERHP
jgi:tetratricopeptide (TPR) repeat protein